MGRTAKEREVKEEVMYKAKHCMKEERTEKPTIIEMTATVSDSDFDRANLKRLMLENNRLKKRNAELENKISIAAARIHDLHARKEKLERALIEAAIK